MNHWLIIGLLFLLIPGGLIANEAEIWRGVVYIADGRAEENWRPPVYQLPDAEGWQRWEQMEKTTRSERLRLSATPNAVMAADTSGRSVLAVAPFAGMSGYVIDAGAGMVDVRGAELKNTMVLLAKDGQIMVKDALLSCFHVETSPDKPAGGTIIIEGCAVTRPFGGCYWGGSQRWVVRNCSFKDSQLPWVNGQLLHVPVIENCHFERCFIPESFLLRTKDCSFDGCTIGSPESFSKSASTFVVQESVSSSNRVLARNKGSMLLSMQYGKPRATFWSRWNTSGEARSGILECQFSNHQVVRPVFLSERSILAGTYRSTEAMRGKIFYRLDAPERLQFDEDGVKVLEMGGETAAGTIKGSAGQSVEWEQTVREFSTDNGFGQSVAAGGKILRKGLYSREESILVVVEEVPGSAPDPVRIFQTAPGNATDSGSVSSQMIGTNWKIEGPTNLQLRFETPTQSVWKSGETGKSGGSVWRPMPRENELMIADWQGDGPAVVKVGAGLKSLEIIARSRTWRGTFSHQQQSGNFTGWNDGSSATAPIAKAGGTEAKPETQPTGSPPGPNSEDAKPVVPGAKAAATPHSLKSSTSRVNGLLVAVLEGGKTAGATSQMNIAAIPAGEMGESSLSFNQKIGPLMAKALEEVRKFQTIRQGRWPTGYRIEVSFADKYTPKDGPSAAVACALLLEGIFTGTVWDSAMAVTGDLNADGSVQPVGGVPAKIKGAQGRKCRIVGIPAGNERAVRDYFLSEGPHSLMGINVFAIKEFDEARDLAMMTRPAALATALTEFDKVIKAAPPKERAGPWLKLPAVAAQLRKVLKAAPTHLSARLLLEYAEGRAPIVLSLTGSIEAIDREAFEVLDAIRSTKTAGNFSGIREDKLGDAVYRLRRMRTQMHPETRGLLDSMETFSTVIRNFLANPPRTETFARKAVSNIQEAGNVVDRKYQSLRNNPEVMAEIMKE